MQKTLLSLLIGVIVGAGAVLVANQRGANLSVANLHTAAPTPQALTMGKTTSGEVTQRSYLNYGDGSRSQRYTFPAVEGTRYKVQVDGPLNANLSVLRNDFLLASSANTSGSRTYCYSSREQSGKRPFYFLADQTGDTMLAVNGADASSYGPFTLVITPEEKTTTTSTPTLSLDAPLENTATGKIDRYTFTVEDEGLYVFDLESCSFDSLLSLKGNGVSATDDDGGDQYNARITHWLTPGEYTLEADTAESTEDTMFGPYTIKASKQVLAANAPLARAGDVLEAGKSVSVLMGYGSDTNPTFTFTLDTPSAVVLTARSSTVDTVLELQGADQSWEDDDSGGGTDARIREVLPAGQYSVTVRGYGRSSGMATLSFEAHPSSAPASGSGPRGARPRPKQDAAVEAIEAASEAAAAGAAAAAEAAAAAK